MIYNENKTIFTIFIINHGASVFFLYYQTFGPIQDIYRYL